MTSAGQSTYTPPATIRMNLWQLGHSKKKSGYGRFGIVAQFYTRPAARSAAAARWARGALYGFLFIGLPGPGGLVHWFFVFTLRPDPPAQQVSPCEERAGRTAAQARKGRGSRASWARPN